MKIAVSNIKNTQPQREHGNIADLKASIAEVGLINPLTIDENCNLLAGRRRYQAIKELDWQEVEAYMLPVNGDKLRAFRVSIDENLKRKPLTDPEAAAVIQEYDELKRKLEGEKRPGRPEIGHTVTDKAGWSLQKTAIDLGISKSAVVKAIQIATAIKEYPELAGKKKGQVILAEYKREQNRKQLLEGQKPRESLVADIQDALVECKEAVSEDGIHYKVFTRSSKDCFELWSEADPNDLELIKDLMSRENRQLAHRLYQGTGDIKHITNLLRELRLKHSKQEIKEAYEYYPGVYRKRRPLPYEGFAKEIAALTRGLSRFNEFINTIPGNQIKVRS